MIGNQLGLYSLTAREYDLISKSYWAIKEPWSLVKYLLICHPAIQLKRTDTEIVVGCLSLHSDIFVNNPYSEVGESWVIHHEELRQVEFRGVQSVWQVLICSVQERHTAGAGSHLCRDSPYSLFVFRINGSLVVKATVTHSEAREKYNLSPEVGGKNTDL